MQPDLRAIPRRGAKRLLPRAQGGIVVDAAAQFRDRSPDPLVLLGQRAAPAQRGRRKAPVVSTWRSAVMNAARSAAARPRSSVVPLAFWPGSHSYTDQSKG